MALAGEQAAFVQPVRTVGPELDPLRRHSISAPMRWARNIGAFVSLLHLLEPTFEGRAMIQGVRLVGCPGTELRIPTAAGEIIVGVLIGDLLDDALDPHLPAQRLPMEEQSCAWVFRKIFALPTAPVRIEDEAVLPMPL